MSENGELQLSQSADRWSPFDVEIHEPLADRESGSVPWSATPTKLSNVSEYQKAVRSQSLDILDHYIPSFVDERLAKYVEGIYLSRQANRNTRNAMSYGNQLYKTDTVTDPFLLEAIDRAEHGVAEPYELLAVGASLGLGSIELAKLTHLYGYRLQNIIPMRKSVNEAIALYDGEIFKPPVEEYEIIAHDRAVTGMNHVEFALTMKRKRLVGAVGSSEIYERSSFIVRLDDESHIDQKLAARIKGLVMTEESDEIVNGQERWKTAIMHIKEFIPVVHWLLSENDFESIIPLSTTVYAHNMIVEKLLGEREDNKKTLVRKSDYEQVPSVISARNVAGMLIVNSHRK